MLQRLLDTESSSEGHTTSTRVLKKKKKKADHRWSVVKEKKRKENIQAASVSRGHVPVPSRCITFRNRGVERVLFLSLTIMAANRTERLSELPAYSVSQARLKSLYSDFSRQRVSNPASYTSNIDWWRRALPQFVARGLQDDTSDTLILHASPEMAESLRYEGVGKPLGLAAILVRWFYYNDVLNRGHLADMPDPGRMNCRTRVTSFLWTSS